MNLCWHLLRKDPADIAKERLFWDTGREKTTGKAQNKLGEDNGKRT